jgi:hypothetical protein
MGRLAVDDLEVLVHREIRRSQALEGEELPLGHLERRVAQPLDHVHLAVRQGHLHGLGVDPVPQEHRQVVPPEVIERRLPPPERGVIDDVVVDQRRRVDELDHRGVGDLLLAVVPEQAGGQQQQGGAHPLAAPLGDVAAGLLDEGHVRAEVMTEDRLGGDQLVRHQVDEAGGLGRARNRDGGARALLGIRERLVRHRIGPFLRKGVQSP